MVYAGMQSTTERRYTVKRVITLALIAAAVMGGWSWNDPQSASAAPTVCAPGQHGNPQPGFKPGACSN